MKKKIARINGIHFTSHPEEQSYCVTFRLSDSRFKSIWLTSEDEKRLKNLYHTLFDVGMSSDCNYMYMTYDSEDIRMSVNYVLFKRAERLEI